VADVLAAIDRHFAKAQHTLELSVALSDGAAIAWLYDHGRVVGRHDDDTFAHLRVSLDPADAERFQRRHARAGPGA
jgi:GTP-binding protein HflX